MALRARQVYARRACLITEGPEDTQDRKADGQIVTQSSMFLTFKNVKLPILHTASISTVPKDAQAKCAKLIDDDVLSSGTYQLLSYGGDHIYKCSRWTWPQCWDQPSDLGADGSLVTTLLPVASTSGVHFCGSSDNKMML